MQVVLKPCTNLSEAAQKTPRKNRHRCTASRYCTGQIPTTTSHNYPNPSRFTVYKKNAKLSQDLVIKQHVYNTKKMALGETQAIIAEHALHKEIAAHERNAHTHTHTHTHTSHTIKWPADKWNQINTCSRWRYSVTIENYTNYTIIMGKLWQMISVGKFGSDWGCTASWPTARNVSNIKT